METEITTIQAPYYLFTSPYGCWQCGQNNFPVIAIGTHVNRDIDDFDHNDITHSDTEFVILMQTETLDAIFYQYIVKRFPHFKRTYSRTMEETYYCNTCPDCGALMGDFYLHSEPGGAFFPCCDDDLTSLAYFQLPFTQSYDIITSYHSGSINKALLHDIQCFTEDDHYLPTEILTEPSQQCLNF